MTAIPPFDDSAQAAYPIIAATSSTDESTLTAQDDLLPEPLPDPCLTVLFSPDLSIVGRTWRLERSPMAIARGNDLSGVAADDRAVSRPHAEIVWDATREAHMIRDAGSHNGTFVNARRISVERLAPGDIIRCGNTILRYDERCLRPGSKPAAPKGCLVVGASPEWQSIIESIGQVAKTDMSVLILGETGVGKEMVAQEIHRQSGRRGEFVAANCAAITPTMAQSELFGHKKNAFPGAEEKPGLVRRAHRGTLLLDEVGELSTELQAMLLRVLQEGTVTPVGYSESFPVDVRFLFATNRDIDAALQAGTFRSDFHARIQWHIDVPPLQERPEDLFALLVHFLRKFGKGQSYEVSGVFFEALALYPWSGNVRALKHMVERLTIVHPQGGRLTLAHLERPLLDHLEQLKAGTANKEQSPAAAMPSCPVPEDIIPTAAELRILYEQYRGNIAAIARHLKRDRSLVHRWLRRYGILAPKPPSNR